MLRILLPTLLLVAAVACSEGDDRDQASEPTAEPEAGTCAYQLHDDLTGESTSLDAFPSELQPTAVFESGDDLLVTADDPADPARDLTIVVPACKRTEAQPFHEGLTP